MVLLVITDTLRRRKNALLPQSMSRSHRASMSRSKTGIPSSRMSISLDADDVAASKPSRVTTVYRPNIQMLDSRDIPGQQTQFLRGNTQQVFRQYLVASVCKLPMFRDICRTLVPLYSVPSLQFSVAGSPWM